MSKAHFAYAQARLHARLERRLSETDWQALAGSRNFGNCLDVINQTPAANITSRLDRTNSVHAVERVLREEWGGNVAEIAGWLPEKWRHATNWMVLLPHLRRFEYSTGNDHTPGWLRLKAEFGDLAEAVLPEETVQSSTLEVTKIWRNGWGLHMPVKQHVGEIDTALTPLLDRYLGNETIKASKSWQELGRYLKGLFRNHPQTPVAIFAYLGLVALDFERLRGVLVDRIIFSELIEPEEV